MEAVAADFWHGLLAAEKRYRSTAAFPLDFPLLKRPEPAGGMGTVEGALSHGLTLDAVFLNEPEDKIRRSAQHLDKALTIRLPHNANHVIRHEPETGVDRPDIAAGTAEADLFGFQKNGIHSRLRQVQCGG